jgi:hypothetical protein
MDIIKVYTDVLGHLVAVARDGAVYSLTTDKVLPKTAENYGLQFLGKFRVQPEEDHDIPTS